jgi:hypothetical protein
MELLLNKQELLNLGANLRGIKIVCLEGRCWLTQAGDSRDHILRAGGAFAITANGQLMVTAVDTCRLSLSAEQQGTGLRVPLKPLLTC